MAFTKATKRQSKARIALISASGAGKTFTALRLATGIADGGKIAVLDSERGSASKYADQFSFDVDDDFRDFSPATYVEKIKAAAAAGYDVLVIDSLSHAWMGTNGALEMVDNAKRRSSANNSFTAWRDVTPLHNAMIDSIVSAPLHIIVTMRAKTEYVMEKDDRGKTVPRKVGIAPVQRDGLEYEFDIVGELNQEHDLIISKTRCPALVDKVVGFAGEELGKTIRAWLTDGVPESPKETPPTLEENMKYLVEALSARGLSSAEIDVAKAKIISTAKRSFDKFSARNWDSVFVAVEAGKFDIQPQTTAAANAA